MNRDEVLNLYERIELLEKENRTLKAELEFEKDLNSISIENLKKYLAFALYIVTHPEVTKAAAQTPSLKIRIDELSEMLEKR